MTNTCQSCKWSYISFEQSVPVDFPINNLRCHPGGDKERDQVADITCLKWQLDDGGEL
jgi:hypothetical protein